MFTHIQHQSEVIFQLSNLFNIFTKTLKRNKMKFTAENLDPTQIKELALKLAKVKAVCAMVKQEMDDLRTGRTEKMSDRVMEFHQENMHDVSFTLDHVVSKLVKMSAFIEHEQLKN